MELILILGKKFQSKYFFKMSGFRVKIFSRISRNFSREMGQFFSHLARNSKREKCACLFKIDHRKKRCKKDPHLQKPLSCDPKVKLTDFQRPRPNRKAVRRPCSGKSGSERKKQFPKNAFLGAARGACVFHCLPLYSLLRLPIEHEKTLIN